jgi:hypothetical protein
MAKPLDQNCGNCRFFGPDASNIDERLPETVGWCMRYPPTHQNYHEGTGRSLERFTTTDATWWCGEYVKALPA